MFSTFYKSPSLLSSNLSFESFVLDRTTFALLFKTTLFLSKKHRISVYILSHLTGFDSSMSLHKYYLASNTFFGKYLTTGHLPGKRPSLYSPASFMSLLDTFILDILLIEVGNFRLHYHQCFYRDTILRRVANQD